MDRKWMTSSDRKWSKGRRSRRECRRTPRTVGLLGFPPRVDDVYKPEVVFGRPEVVELSLYEVGWSTRAWSAAVPRECGHVRACTGVRRVRVDSENCRHSLTNRSCLRTLNLRRLRPGRPGDVPSGSPSSPDPAPTASGPPHFSGIPSAS